MDKFKQRGAEVSYYDPHIPKIRLTREHSHWESARSVKWNRETVASFDATLISTAHDVVNFQELTNWASLIIDTRNVMDGIKSQPGQIWKA